MATPETKRERGAPRLPTWLAMLLVRGYQVLISPLLHALGGPAAGCRFSPTCSEYALQALRAHGFFRGGWLALKRIARCHPWHPGGDDPVPGPREPRRSKAG